MIQRSARRQARRLCLATALAGASLALASAAQAQDTAPPSPITISGSAAVVTDYRLRGVSQSNNGFALQAGVTIAHESGFYVGTWGSNLAGWGTFGGPNLELDAIGGFKKTFGPATLDVGLTWYMYPGGAAKTDFAEPFVKLSGTVGPVSALAGVAYAPKQQALGQWYDSGASYVEGTPDHPGAKNDNLYVWGDVSGAIPSTPDTLKAHLGYSKGNPGLGPNGTSVAPTGSYADWLLGADLALGKVVLGVAYIDTNISDADAAYLRPNFTKFQTQDGASISSSRVVLSATVNF